MSSKDYEWWAEVLAAQYFKGNITSDGVNEIIERMGHKEAKFDKAKFYSAFSKYYNMFVPR